MLPGTATSPTEPPPSPTWQSSAAAHPGLAQKGRGGPRSEQGNHREIQPSEHPGRNQQRARKEAISYRVTVKKLGKISGNYHHDQHLQNCIIIQKDASICPTR